MSAGPAPNNPARAASDLVTALYEGFQWHRFGEGRPDDSAVSEQKVPVFSIRDGRLSCRYVRRPIVAGQRDAAQSPTQLQIEALDPAEREALWSALNKLQTAAIRIEPLTGALGAQIHGQDLRQPLGKQERALIQSAFDRHLLLTFHGQQDLSPEQHIAFSEIFGEIAATFREILQQPETVAKLQNLG